MISFDKYTDVVVSYIESVVDGRRFIEKAKILSGKKPFILLKSGKSRSGQSAAFSHTVYPSPERAVRGLKALLSI